MHHQQVTISVKAKPKAKKTALLGVADGYVNIALHAAPTEGAANAVLISYLADLLEVPKSQISILRGELSRYKVVQLPLTKTVQKFIDSYS